MKTNYNFTGIIMIGKLLNKNLIILWLVFGSILCNENYDSRIMFPGPVNRGSHYDISPSSGMSLEMEIQLAQQYNQIENIEDFFSRIDGLPTDININGSSIISRSGDGGRDNFERPKPATCTPEMQPVSLRNSTAPSSLIYIPSCTRVYRCGGCCGHMTLSCEPTEKILRNFQVLITEYDVNAGLTYKQKEIVPIEEHRRCACGCKTKAHHCNEKQNYLDKECRCVCINVDEASKCRRNNETKEWDDNSCVCRCRGPTECTTGSYYDHNTCSCKKIGLGGNRRHVDPSLRSYTPNNNFGIVKSLGPIIPPSITISANDPRRRHRDDPEV